MEKSSKRGAARTAKRELTASAEPDAADLLANDDSAQPSDALGDEQDPLFGAMADDRSDDMFGADADQPPSDFDDADAGSDEEYASDQSPSCPQAPAHPLTIELRDLIAPQLCVVSLDIGLGQFCLADTRMGVRIEPPYGGDLAIRRFSLTTEQIVLLPDEDMQALTLKLWVCSHETRIGGRVLLPEATSARIFSNYSYVTVTDGYWYIDLDLRSAESTR